MVTNYNSISEYLKTTTLGIPKTMDELIVYGYGDVEDSTAVTHDAYRTQFYEVSLEINQGCSFQIDSFKFPLENNRLTFVAPGRLQTYLAHSDFVEESTGFTLLFSKDFISKHFNPNRFSNSFDFLSPTVSPAVYLGDKELAEIQNIFEILRYEYREYGHKSSEVIKSLIKAIFEKAKQHHFHIGNNETSISRQEQIVFDFEKLCQEYFRTKHTVNEYAKLMYISPKHLSETIKHVTGKTALEIIADYKLNHAKGLISQTPLSIKEIAYESGFESTPYFSTFFKKHIGLTPLEFRRI